MARRLFFALRRRRKIRVQEFLQFRARIPYRSCTRTCQGNGGVCTDCPDFCVAGALHGGHRGETVEQRSPTRPVALLPAGFGGKTPCCYLLGQRNSSRYSGVFSGASPWRVTFSVTTRGTRKLSK